MYFISVFFPIIVYRNMFFSSSTTWERSTMHLKFDLTGIRTHDLQIMIVHFMLLPVTVTACPSAYVWYKEYCFYGPATHTSLLSISYRFTVEPDMAKHIHNAMVNLIIDRTCVPARIRNPSTRTLYPYYHHTKFSTIRSTRTG